MWHSCIGICIWNTFALVMKKSSIKIFFLIFRLKGLLCEGSEDSPIIHLRLLEPYETFEEDEEKLKQVVANVSYVIGLYHQIKKEGLYSVHPVWSNIYTCIKHKRLCLAMFLHTEKRVENMMCTIISRLFFTNIEVFGNIVKHGLECWIYLLNWN